MADRAVGFHRRHHGRSNEAQALFVRSDVDGSGRVDVTDAVTTLRHLFQGEEELPSV